MNGMAFFDKHKRGEKDGYSRKRKETFICEMGSWVVGNPDENSTTTAVKSARGGGAVYAGNASQAARYQFRLAWRRAILSAGRKYQKRVSEEAHTTLLESMRQSLTDEFKSIWLEIECASVSRRKDSTCFLKFFGVRGKSAPRRIAPWTQGYGRGRCSESIGRNGQSGRV